LSDPEKMKNFIAFVLFSILLIACSKQTDIDPALQIKSSGLFTYTIIPEGDGTVTFKADSTQIIKEYLWDFGDRTTPTTTTIGTVSHIFTKNMSFQVKLTAKNSNNQVVDTKGVVVNSRLARTFDDLPANERSTIRILHVLTTNESLYHKDVTTQLKNAAFKDYTDKVFKDFINRTGLSAPKEFENLSFEHILYMLPPEDTLKFYTGRDPDAYFKQLLVSPKETTYQNILKMKQKVAASRICFLMENPVTSVITTPSSISRTYKYNYAGYAPYEGGYIVAFNIGVITHEMGHSFGFAHDTQRDSRYWPLMMAPETKVIGAESLLWSDLRELQVNELNHNLLKLKNSPPFGGEFVIPEYWKFLFPNNPILENLTLKGIATTPYYTSGIDLVSTLKKTLIEQYNIKIAPNLYNSITDKPKISGSRISIDIGSFSNINQCQ
jgi:PKD repeat protein